MTSTRKARPASRWMGLICAALAASPAHANGRALDLIYERTVMIAADERCGLFAPEIATALIVAQAQARGAALRAGASPDDVGQVERRARGRGLSLGCASPDLASASARVREAYAGYARLQRITYPGEIAVWRADRTGRGAIRWRLAQETRFGPHQMTFGLAGREAPGSLLAVGLFADGAVPYAARLVMRDDQRSRSPYLAQLEAGQATPLERRLPPRSAAKVFAAEARSAAGQDLLPKTSRTGWAFRFPPQAARALAQLDPREAVAVEFLFQRDGVRRAYVEVGDFAAGRAFLTLAER